MQVLWTKTTIFYFEIWRKWVDVKSFLTPCSLGFSCRASVYIWLLQNSLVWLLKLESLTTKITVLQVLLSRGMLIFCLSDNNVIIVISLCCTQLKCSVMIFILQGHVQQYQLYYIRGLSQERNAVTEKARNSKRWTLDTIRTIFRQNISW